MLATTSSHALSILEASPQLFKTLHHNITLFRSILSKLETEKDALISIPSHEESALIHIFLLNPPGTMVEEEKLLQRVVDETIESGGVLITRARRLRGQETFEPEPSLKICLSGALGKKDVEKAAQGLKAALVKVCGSKSIHLPNLSGALPRGVLARCFERLLMISQKSVNGNTRCLD